MTRVKKDSNSTGENSDGGPDGAAVGLDLDDQADTNDDVQFTPTGIAASSTTASAPASVVVPAVIQIAFNEIQAEADAAKHALTHVKATDLPESVQIPEMDRSSTSTALTEEQASQLYEKKRLRALKEREKGLAKLTEVPTRVGEMVFSRQVSICDVALANMAKRFVYVSDRLLSRLHGFGANLMGEDKAATAVEIMTAKIDEFHRNAKMLYDQSKQAIVIQREVVEKDGGTWHQSNYPVVAMEVEVHLLRREGNKFLESFVLYDKAIAEMRRLEFNFGTETDQIDLYIAKARKDSYQIYRSALSGQVELGRILAGRRSKSNNDLKSTEPQGGTERVATGDLVEA